MMVTDVQVDVRVLLNGEQAISTTVLVGASGSSAKQEQEVRLPSIAIERPQLWWPVGHGEPHLYEVEVLYGTAPISAPISGLEGKERREAERSPQRLSKRIGLRTVELVQDPILSQSREEEQKQQQEEKVTVLARTGAGEPATLYKVAPATYYLRINGRAVFMRGANYIPIDSFRSRVTAADRAYVLRAALQSNMNMVRVWGGGAYEEDDFYALADELGLLVWQEVMLACALYPRDDAFLAEVAAEVRHQALRLGDHPSIVVFGGQQLAFRILHNIIHVSCAPMPASQHQGSDSHTNSCYCAMYPVHCLPACLPPSIRAMTLIRTVVTVPAMSFSCLLCCNLNYILYMNISTAEMLCCIRTFLFPY